MKINSPSRSNRKTDGQTVEEHIIQGIRSGRYRPSKRLGEASVAKELGVGQATVRVAIGRLTHLGILDRRHRAGTYVRELSMQEFVELTQVRALLEGFACRLACSYATAEELEELASVGRELDEQLGKLTPKNYRDVEQKDLAFHEKLVAMSRSSTLIQMLSEKHLILSCLRRGFDLPSAFAGSDNAAPTHGDLVDVLTKRDPVEADACMRRHLMGCLRADLRLGGVIEF